MKQKIVNYIKESDHKQVNYEQETFIKPLKKMVTVADSGRPRGIKLPKYIFFNLDSDTLHLYIQEQTTSTNEVLNPTCENMQTDNAAFEGWAITLKAWFPLKINKVVLKWDIPSPNLQNEHYYRFLYRVIRFTEKYKWFSIDTVNIVETEKFLKNKWYSLTINVSTTEPKKKSNDENAVEYEITDKERPDIREKFLEKFRLWLFNHQLHVGVKSKGSLLFTGGQSAIDLWAVSNSKNKLSLFELKYINYQKTGNKNIKVGIISELFLYACIMEDIINGTIQPEKPVLEDERKLYSPSVIKGIKKIDAIMLSNEFHPLVDSPAVIELLNLSNTTESGTPIHFKSIRYHYVRGSYNFDFVSEQ